MANYESARVAHATGANGQVDQITLDTEWASAQVVNVGGTARLYVQNQPWGAPANPTVKGADCLVVPAGVGASATIRLSPAGQASILKVIADGATDYSVEGGDL